MQQTDEIPDDPILAIKTSKLEILTSTAYEKGLQQGMALQKQAAPEEELMTQTEVARFWRRTRQTIDNWERKKYFTRVNPGDGGYPLYRKSDMIALLKKEGVFSRARKKNRNDQVF